LASLPYLPNGLRETRSHFGFAGWKRQGDENNCIGRWNRNKERTCLEWLERDVKGSWPRDFSTWKQVDGLRPCPSSQTCCLRSLGLRRVICNLRASKWSGSDGLRSQCWSRLAAMEDEKRFGDRSYPETMCPSPFNCEDSASFRVAADFGERRPARSALSVSPAGTLA
jgi:hypothetical protein